MIDVGILGATGMVGQQFLRLLDQASAHTVPDRLGRFGFVDAAQEEFDTARKEAGTAVRAREQAEKRLEEATTALAAAKART